MPYHKTIFKLTTKAFKYAFARPMQRFNIYNRMKKYLGPEARYFAPAPRAIGALSLRDGKPLQYPHLESGYKSINQRRIDALAKGDNSPNKLADPQTSQPTLTRKAFSETENDDRFVIDVSHQLEVTKTITKIQPQTSLEAVDQAKQPTDDGHNEKKHRPLPKCTNLPLQDPAFIWAVDKTQPGRLNVNQLQEIMINKLGDDKYWTPKAVAEKYDIKEEYAESLFKYMKQIRIVISPRVAKNLDYVGKNDPNYQAAKHLIYHVDNSLRNKKDKQFDEMFLPGEEWDDEVKKVLDVPKTSLEPVGRRVVKRPEPLRIGPLNKSKELESPRKSDRKMSEPSNSIDDFSDHKSS